MPPAPVLPVVPVSNQPSFRRSAAKTLAARHPKQSPLYESLAGRAGRAPAGARRIRPLLLFPSRNDIIKKNQLADPFPNIL